MSTDGKKKRTWIQCNECGHIYQIPHSVPIDKLYVATHCPNCESISGLNLGDDEDDIYLYMNPNIDNRCW